MNSKYLCLWIIMTVAYTPGLCTEGITCYQCTIAPKFKNSSDQICSQFEETIHFETWCPKSTWCMKRTFHHVLVNGTIVQTSVERGCASQLNIYKTYNRHKADWDDKIEVDETAYNLGCYIGEDVGAPGGPSEYCYCNYNLCNASGLLKQKFITLSIIMSSLMINIKHNMMQ